MRWVIWLGVVDEFIVFCRALCDGVLDVVGYTHGYPFIGNSDIYCTTQDTWIGGCIEVDESFGEVGDFFEVCVCIFCLWGIIGI